jgi:phosphoribosylanthranilate isomerase
MRTRVKVCGITRRQDAEIAIEMGADAIGVVFYEPSPRAVTIAQAKLIIEKLPPFVCVVALFVNAEVSFIRQCINQLPINLLQFHGDESAEFCEQFSLPYYKAIRMRDGVDLNAVSAKYASANALLVDSYQEGVPGGTGITFDWSLVQSIEKPIILAGGLTPVNVKTAIAQLKPYAVDVSGGVEKDKGIKVPEKIHAFMQEVTNG